MDVTQYCDECDAELNRQSGFDTWSGTWICSACGCLNDVSENNILSEEDAESAADNQVDCPICGGHMRRDGYSWDEYICEDCGLEATLNDYGVLVYQSDEDDDHYGDDGELLSVYEAAEIWASHGKDEDYMFGYSEDELEDAL